MATARGCGRREAGGIYMITELSPFGRPLEDFMSCPALPVPPDFGVTPLGQRVAGEDNCQMVLDWIGESHYPNVMDFWEEVRHLGASRHITKDTALRLRPGAWLYPIHAKAIIRNWMQYPGRYMGICPKCDIKHGVTSDITDREMLWFRAEYSDLDRKYEYAGCTGYWGEDIIRGTPYNELDEDADERMVRRVMPWGVYGGLRSPSELVGEYYLEPDYAPGMTGRLPINCLHVINGAEESEPRYEALKKNARKNGGLVPIMMEE
jgi:hypothetical protein